MDEFNNISTTEEVVEVENITPVPEQPKPKKMTAWKAVNITLVALFIGYVLFMFIDSYVIPLAKGDSWAALGIIVFWSMLIYGLIGVVAIAVPCIIATVIAFKKKNNCTKGTKALFLILTILPLVFEIVMFVGSWLYVLLTSGK